MTQTTSTTDNPYASAVSNGAVPDEPLDLFSDYFNFVHLSCTQTQDPFSDAYASPVTQQQLQYTTTATQNSQISLDSLRRQDDGAPLPPPQFVTSPAASSTSSSTNSGAISQVNSVSTVGTLVSNDSSGAIPRCSNFGPTMSHDPDQRARSTTLPNNESHRINSPAPTTTLTIGQSVLRSEVHRLRDHALPLPTHRCE